MYSDIHDVGITSPGGYRYWVTFIDDYTHFRAVMFMKRKSDTFKTFRQFKAWAETVTGRKIKILRHDKGGEYMSNEFIAFCKEHGIAVQKTARNRPQQNGVSERANRTLAEMLTAALNESGLPKTFWAECLTALVHVWNRCPTSAVTDSTPYERWYNEKPKVDHLRVWGCVAYVHVQKDKREALGSHMEKCIFIGYPEGMKAWKFWNPVTKKVVISERADFDERYMYKSLLLKKNFPIVTSPPLIHDKESEYFNPPDECTNSEPSKTPYANPPLERGGNDNAIDPGEMPPVVPEEGPADEHPIALRKPARARRPPGEYWKVQPAPEPAPAQAPMPAIPPIDPNPEQSDSEPSGDDNESSDGEYGNAAASVQEPQSFKEALNSAEADQWGQAMVEEITAHLSNGTWEVVDLPPGRVAIGSKWIYKIKHKVDGTIERFKARLVAQGFSQ